MASTLRWDIGGMAYVVVLSRPLTADEQRHLAGISLAGTVDNLAELRTTVEKTIAGIQKTPIAVIDIRLNDDAWVVQRRPRIRSGGPTDQWCTLSERDFTRDPNASEDTMAPTSHDDCGLWIANHAQGATLSAITGWRRLGDHFATRSSWPRTSAPHAGFTESRRSDDRTVHHVGDERRARQLLPGERYLRVGVVDDALRPLWLPHVDVDAAFLWAVCSPEDGGRRRP